MCNHSTKLGKQGKQGKQRWQNLLMIAGSAFLLSSCATTKKDPADPWESYNRAVYKFNESVDTVVFKPAATVYSRIVPAPITRSISRFYANLHLPLTIVNDVLQANPKQAIADTWRFGINSTFGLLGLFDVAKGWGLQDKPQTFGITVAKWGLWKESAYLVAPFFGPTTIRDSMMMPLDILLTPWPYLKPRDLNLGLYGLNVVDNRARLLSSDDLVDNIAVDEYIFVRDAFLQYRRNQIHPENMNKTSEKDLQQAFEGNE